jgi:branched-subunit amino acid aminotransferase/4-amino-4-deoxychorismate lyase
MNVGDPSTRPALVVGAPPAPLLETLRAVGTTLLRWPLHRERLRASAAALRVAVDVERVQDEITAALAAVNAAEAEALVRPVWRVRVVVDAGDVTVRITPHVDDAGPARVAWSAAPIRADDPARRHKTLDRGSYDAATAWARERGIDEVLFCNDLGRVAEGAISNVFVEGGDGRLRTPPVVDGALPGVLRAALLARGAAVEAGVAREELQGARVLIGNALRGLRQVVWSDDVFVP